MVNILVVIIPYSIIKIEVEWKVSHLPQLVEKLHDIHTTGRQVQNLEMAIVKRGEGRFCKEFQYLEHSGMYKPTLISQLFPSKVYCSPQQAIPMSSNVSTYIQPSPSIYFPTQVRRPPPLLLSINLQAHRHTQVTPTIQQISLLGASYYLCYISNTFSLFLKQTTTLSLYSSLKSRSKCARDVENSSTVRILIHPAISS